MPTATPTATTSRSPQGRIVPREACFALKATAISEGSANVAAKPMTAANR